MFRDGEPVRANVLEARQVLGPGWQDVVDKGHAPAFNRASPSLYVRNLARNKLTQRHLDEIQPELIFGSWLPSQQVLPCKAPAKRWGCKAPAKRWGCKAPAKRWGFFLL